MAESPSKKLLEFIALHVDSVEFVEVFILLSAYPDKEWKLQEVDSRIRSSEASVKLRLESMVTLGFAKMLPGEPARFSYSPVDAVRAELGKELVLAYQTHRVEIVKLIYTKPLKEIVSFSSAFNLRRGKKNG